MPLSTATLKDKADWPSKELLTEIEVFVESHYEFKCKPKYKGFIGRIRAFYDREQVERLERHQAGERYYKPIIYGSDPYGLEEATLKAILENSFSIALMELLETKGKDSVEVYKRANIDRKLFSKIRSQKDYIPSKRTVIALALALELSLDETQALLKRAGFALSRSILFDVIIEYFISHGRYDIFEINEVLANYKQPTFS